MNQTNLDGVQVIFGGRGGSSEALARHLHAQGRRVRVVNRSGRAELPTGIEVRQGNLLEPQGLRDALQGATVLYHAANVPYMQWPDLLPPMLEGFLAAGRSSGARLVYVDNLYMYGQDTLNMRDAMPEAPISRKGELRARLGRRLLEAHRAGEVRATLARGSDFFGPHVVSSLLDAEAWRGMLAGKAARWAGRLDMPHALTYTPDFARALALLGEREEALGQSWVIPTAEALTGRQTLELAAEVAGVRPRIQLITRPMATLSGLFVPMHREFLEMLYQFEQPFTVDGSRFARTFGFSPTAHRTALEGTLAWARSSVGVGGRLRAA